MPRRGLAGLVLMVTVVQMFLAPPLFACVAHHVAAGHMPHGTAGHCQDVAPSAASGTIASDAVAVSTLGPPQLPHHPYHDQGCCAGMDACRGVFSPARGTEVGRAVASQSLASATTIAPAARRAAPDSPPPKR